jgi:uncharacterized nucleotidyltransferase DUF6036
MRELADAAAVRVVLERLARATTSKVRIYLTGGATAVLHGWRATTIDLDLKLVPEDDALLRAIPRLKEELRTNVELAAPDQFIPALPGWEDRSLFIEQIGSVSIYHYDPYSQALAKIERGHAHDLEDAHRMMSEGLVEPARLRELFDAIEPDLYRYPAVDRPSFRRALEVFLKDSLRP